jgi:beta-N-acetylhexosaminidase
MARSELSRSKKSVTPGGARSRPSQLAVAILLLAALGVTTFNTVPAQKRGGATGDNEGKTEFRAAERVNPFRVRPSAVAVRWAETRLRHMSPAEKVGQLISVGVNGRYISQDSEAYKELRRQVEENHIGGIVLFEGSVYESVHLANRMQGLAKIPLLISADMEYGAGMRFKETERLPTNMAVAATGDPALARRQGEIIAREARALGVRQVYGPVVDVNNNAGNPIINVRAYGEDAADVARFSAAFIEGAQANGVIATAKHFPGHGNTAIDSHRGLPVINVSRKELEAVEFVPYRAAIGKGLGSVMASFIGLPQIDPEVIEPLPRDQIIRPEYVGEGEEIVAEGAVVPAALSPKAVEGLLRRELKFDGLIVTDALDMSALTIYFRQGEAAVRAVLAGADMLVKPSNPDEVAHALLRAVAEKRISRERLDQSVRRILAAKYDLGLVRRRDTPLDQIDRLLSDSAVVRFEEEVAERAITLVRNDAHLLPAVLPPDATILNLAITNGEDRFSISIPFVTELERLAHKPGRAGWRVKTVVLDARSSPDEVSRALQQARAADLVFASLYGRVVAGAAGSAGLPASAAQALAELIGEGKVRLVGISFGNPYLLKNFPGLRTYAVAYGDMPSLQKAAARALLGETDITGKLPIGLPSDAGSLLYRRGDGIQLKAVTKTDSENVPAR